MCFRNRSFVFADYVQVKYVRLSMSSFRDGSMKLFSIENTFEGLVAC